MSELRKRHMKQNELADLADMQQSYVNELLNLKKRWNVENLEKISNALDMPAWQLFADPSEVLPQEYLEWADDYARLDKDSRRIVDSMLKATRVQTKAEQDAKKKKNV
jgi:transcriptional regulator with XRE-family HTH domain